MIGDMCVCGEYDCPDWEEHAKLVRLDMDTWPPDGSDPDLADPEDDR